MLKIKPLLLIPIIACLFLNETILQAHSATHTAESVSYSDVNDAISNAQMGDTVIVPSGSAVWSDTLKITKGITLNRKLHHFLGIHVHQIKAYQY
jgi:hypothetical protein